MSIYKMTPADRRAYAQMIRAERNSRYAKALQQKAQREAEEQRKQQEQDQLAAEKKVQDANPLARIGATLLDISTAAQFGAYKSLEGIADLAIGAVGAIGGLFSDEFEAGAKKKIEYDFTGNVLEKPYEWATKYSYLNDSKAGEITENVLRGVGGMLPAVAVTLLTGGAGATPALAQGLGLATTGVGAAGQATEEAYKDGAGYGEGLAYGVASGAVEAATEKLLGGPTSNIFGKGMLDDVAKIGKSVADTGVKRVIKDAAGEAFEEAVAEVATPSLKTIYKGRDALADYKDPAYWGGVGEAALVGGLTSVVYGGTVGRATGGTGRAAEISDSLSEIEGLRQKQNNLFANDKLTDATQSALRTATEANLRNIETALQKSKPERRAALIEQYGLSEGFDAEGKIKPDYADKLLGRQVAADVTNAPESGGFAADRRYYSPALWGRGETVTAELETINADLQQKNGADISPVEVFEGELADTARDAYSQMKKGFAKLSSKTRTGLNFVLVKPNEKINGVMLSKGNTVYIGADTLENGTWAGKLVHEVTHFAEGSKAYAKLMRHLAGDEDLFGSVVSRLTSSENGYGFDEGTVDSLLEKLERGERLSDVEAEFVSELGANLSEAVLGNERFIEKLVRDDTSLAERIMERIRDLKDAFARLTNKEARAEHARLQKAEKLYLEAVENAGWRYVKGRIEKEKEDEGVDNEGAVRYNMKEEELYTSSSEFIREVHKYDRSSFSRQLANKTVNVSEDRPCSVTIYCGQKIYCFYATGYMQGEMLDSILVREDNVLEKVRKRFENGINTDAEGSNIWADIVPADRSGSESNISFAQNGREANDADYLPETARKSDKSRDIKRSWANSDELLKEANLLVKKLRELYDGDESEGDLSSKSGIRYSMKTDTERSRNFNDRDGQELKAEAQVNREKVYTRTEARQIINSILSKVMNFDDAQGTLIGSTEQTVEMLWKGLNSADPGERGKVALDVADFIIRNAMVRDTYQDPANEVHRERLELLSTYLHKLDLSSIKGEIRHKYDKDTSVYLRWGKHKGMNGMTPDMVADELAELGFSIDADHPADILFEMDAAYRKSSEALKRRANTALKDFMQADELKTLKQEISREILRGFDEKGSATKLSKTINEYTEKIMKLRGENRELHGRNDLVNRALSKLKKLKDIKLGTYHRSSEFNDARFRGSIERLASIENRGVLREKKTREIFAELAPWYHPKNALFENQDGIYQQDIADMMEQLAHGDGDLTNAEVRMLIDVVDYFTHMVNTYNKVYRDGKYVDALDVVKDYIKKMDQAKSRNVGLVNLIFRGFHKAKTKHGGYMGAFASPLSLMRFADAYDEHGFYTETLKAFQQGEVDMRVMEMQILKEYNAFFKENKNFQKRIETETVEWGGQKIPLKYALGLYMTTKREQAHRHMARGGFAIELDGEVTDFMPLVDYTETMSDEEIKVHIEAFGRELEKSFSKTDKAFLKIVERILNEDCKKAKAETDMLKNGYTNVIEGFYYPTTVADSAKSIEQEGLYDELNKVNRLSINQNTVKGASGKLLIRPIDLVVERHVHAVSMYANLAIPVDNFNRVFNLNIGENPHAPISINSITSRTEKERNLIRYLKRMVADIEGRPKEGASPWWNESIGKLRSRGATAALGLNPKVLTTQFSSLFAALNVLDFDCIVKGIAVQNKWKEVDSYSPLAELRNSENGAALAQTLTEKLDKFSEKLMWGVGKMDRVVIGWLFGAAQLQAQKNNAGQIGTIENKRAAGALLDRIQLETQQNSLTSIKSEVARGNDEVGKSFAMFSLDLVQNSGRWIDAIGEMLTLKRMLKNEQFTQEERATIEARLKKATKQFGRSTAAIFSAALYMALIAQLFRLWYRRDEEEEKSLGEKGLTFAADTIGGLLGGLPVIRDIYSLFVDGYAIETFVLSNVNNALEAVDATVDLAKSAIQGKDISSQDVMAKIKNLVVSFAQLYGLPVRNVYNMVSGTLHFSKSAGYRFDNIFYEQSYSSDLAKAIEADDEKMISTISGLIVDEKIGTESKAVRQALRTLTSEGYSVLPRTLGDTVTYDDEEIELTAGQKKEFRKIYSASDEAVEDLVKLDSFQKAGSEEQAKAVRFIYDTYYNLARDEILGEDSESKNVLFAEAIDIEKLALLVVTARGMTADKDSSGAVVSGSKKKKVTSYISGLKLTAVQKYMIMGYLGYSNKYGEAAVRSYINKLNLSKAEKELLLKYSGY